MKLRLHELELGTTNPQAEAAFFQTLFGWTPSVDQPALQVFPQQTASLDFNHSTHQPAGTAVLRFLTNDLAEMINRLQSAAVSFEGPMDSHLGLWCVRFHTPGSYTVEVSQPGNASPAWLTV